MDTFFGEKYEAWSLAIHAAACAELFQNRKRKKAYLDWVANYFGKVLQLQETLGYRTKHKRELITYLAEIGFERVMRVIDPSDTDFVNSKAAKLIDQLKLKAPPQYAKFYSFDKDIYQQLPGREKLWAHAGSISKLDLSNYKALHRTLHATSLRFTANVNLGGITCDIIKNPVAMLAFQNRMLFGTPQEKYQIIFGKQATLPSTTASPPGPSSPKP